MRHNVVSLRSQWREFMAGGSPAVYRILIHGMLFGLSFSISDILFNFYLTSMGYDNAVAGQMQSVFRLAGVFLGLPIGMIIDRISALRMLYIGILVYAIGWGVLLTFDRSTLVTPWGTVPPQQIMNILYFFIGAANMATYTAVVPLLSTVIEPKRRAAMFGINAAASTMVGFVGSLVGGSLPGFVAPLLGVSATSEPAYRTAMYTVVVFGLLATVPLLGVGAQSKKQAQTAASASDTPPAPPVSVPFTRIMLLVTPSFFFGTAGGLFVPFQNLFFRQEFGMSDSAVGFNLALASLGMGIGSMIGGPLSVRLGVRRAASWSRVLAAPLTLMMLVPWLPLVSFAYDINRLLVGLTFPLFSALMMQTVPLHQRGTSTSMSSMSWSLGWAAASALSGTLQADGFTIVLILSAVSYVISGTLVAVLPYHDNLE
jgi:MFS family permease